MYENSSSPKKKLDRRIQHTREILGDALVALIHEKPFDTITVQQVLDRAGVSRSTFYQHYRDKEDLFVSDVDEFFELMATLLLRRQEISARVAPVREFFTHVGETVALLSALTRSNKLFEVMEMGELHFARAIEDRLAELPDTRGIPVVRRSAIANALAAALFGLLSWWTRRGMPISSTEMDELFHSLLWNGITRA